MFAELWRGFLSVPGARVTPGWAGLGVLSVCVQGDINEAKVYSISPKDTGGGVIYTPR